MNGWIARRSTARRNLRDCRPRLEALEGRGLLSGPGTLDPTFGTGGIVMAPSGRGFAVAIQPDGKIVVAGLDYASYGHVFRLARYNTNGTLDTTFGSGGSVSTSPTRYGGDLWGVAIQPDGKIVAVGDADLTAPSPGNYYNIDYGFAVVRYNANGTLDTGFGGGKKPTGIVVTNLSTLSGFEHATSLVIQPDGKIVVAGVVNHSGTGDDIAVARYNASGTLDSTFGSNGVVSSSPITTGGADGANAVALQSDGKIVVAGGSALMEVVRYLPNGQLDASFGSGGAVVGLVPPGDTESYGTSFVIQGDGSIVVAGYSAVSSNFDATVHTTLARLTGSGQLDTTFGSSGFAETNLPTEGNAIALAPNGDLLVAGPYEYPSPTNPAVTVSDFGLAAFLPTGMPDTTFGSSGQTSADFHGGYDTANAIAVQSDGNIVVAGDSNTPSSNTFALARFTGFPTMTMLAAAPAPSQGAPAGASAGTSADPTSAASSGASTASTVDWATIAPAAPIERPAVAADAQPRPWDIDLSRIAPFVLEPAAR